MYDMQRFWEGFQVNRTAIEFVLNPDGTQGFNWPIITGCLHPCRNQYCYNTMKKTSPLNRFYKKNREKETGELHYALPAEGLWPYGFDPTYYPYRLEEPMARKKPSTIFVANGGDVFGKWIPEQAINCILTVIRDCPQHTFIILTKNFGRLYEFVFPDNCWVGFSQEYCSEVHMDGIKAKVKFVSFEPLHSGFDFDSRDPGGYRKIVMHGISWIILGKETGPREKEMKPKRDWIMTLVKSAHEQGISVWMKNNLAPSVLHNCNLIQELPNVR
jgi:protein gp37